jgi:KDO2-lipid IV(A) lauroyltransferase
VIGRTPAGPPGAPAAPHPATRWYRHGWNRDLSWRLIHAIVPRLPRVLRPPVHFLTTAICYLAMPAERRAARRNLARIAGTARPAPHRQAFRLFYNFSRFMTGYTDLLSASPDRLRDRLAGAEAAREGVERALAEGKGLVIVTLHLGHWESGLALLAAEGRPVHVVLRQDPSAPSAWTDRARARPGLRVVAGADTVWQGIDLLLALRGGGTVAMMGDRAAGETTRPAVVCGAPLPIPEGPFALARAAGAPILVIAVPMVGGDRFTFEVHGPIAVGADEPGIAAAVGEYARILESILRRHPTQWFTFYDVWGT